MWRRRPLGSLRARLRPESRTRRRENPEAAAHHALHAIRRVSDAMHARVLALVDELIDMRDEIEEARQPRGLYATTRPEDPSIPVTANM